MLEQQQRQAEQQRQVNQLLRANQQWHEEQQRLINQQQKVVPHQQVHQQYQQASVQRTQTTLEQRCLADQQRLLMQQRRQADQQCQADQVLQANQQRQAGHQVTQQQQETPVPRMRTTLVASDSMTCSIRVQTINNMLNANSLIHQEARKIEIDKFPGAHANKIRHCFQYSLQEFQPDTMVVIAGANDITYDSQAGNADAKQIAAKVTNIARDALAKGVRDVYVFGITQRRNKQFNQLIKQTNLELRLLCGELNIHYVDTGDIHLQDIDRDGIHLNVQGTKKLTRKILGCDNNYNPMLQETLGEGSSQ